MCRVDMADAGPILGKANVAGIKYLHLALASTHFEFETAAQHHNEVVHALRMPVDESARHELHEVKSLDRSRLTELSFGSGEQRVKRAEIGIIVVAAIHTDELRRIVRIIDLILRGADCTIRRPFACHLELQK